MKQWIQPLWAIFSGRCLAYCEPTCCRFWIFPDDQNVSGNFGTHHTLKWVENHCSGCVECKQLIAIFVEFSAIFRSDMFAFYPGTTHLLNPGLRCKSQPSLQHISHFCVFTCNKHMISLLKHQLTVSMDSMLSSLSLIYSKSNKQENPLVTLYLLVTSHKQLKQCHSHYPRVRDLFINHFHTPVCTEKNGHNTTWTIFILSMWLRLTGTN